ncbi:MAG: tyrosine-type recombinase/integrase [Isosphaeraceae bacterium]
MANGRRPPVPVATGPDASQGPADLTINELALAYLRFAEGYYRKNGEPTSEVRDTRLSVRPLRQLYGTLPVGQFGPLQLKAVRQAMVESGLCRNEVNKRTQRLVRLFGWGVEEALVPPSVHWGLKAVKGLKKGRCGVRESEPVKPVPDAFVDAISHFVPAQIWAMVRLQRLSGMRPHEVCCMRTIDIDMTGPVWVFTPETHKTEHHGKERRIYLGPTAQEILRPWLRAELTTYLFSPLEVMERRQAERRRDRRTPLTPSQRRRKRKRKPKRAPGIRYDTRSYYHAVHYGIRKANREIREAGGVEIRDWHPNQLRHNAATRLRREFGLDVTRAVLGHSSPVVTEVYAELDQAKAAEAMARIG